MLFTDLKSDGVTQYDVLNFFVAAIETGYLSRRLEYILMDNAKTHCAEDTFETMMRIFDAHGVTPIFLPTYSSEFNLCELVFAVAKMFLQSYRNFLFQPKEPILG
ncbi:PcrB [Acrasis kona]|uniref:PcrB n=1 Tax=Acrasis kona TaxID=1008807 RepID=A0AAW2ZRM5_9EUKA